MIDIKVLRSDPQVLKSSQEARGEDPGLVDVAASADADRRAAGPEPAREALADEDATHWGRRLQRQALAAGSRKWEAPRPSRSPLSSGGRFVIE